MIIEVLSWACLLGGGALGIIGGIGIHRFPDFFSRMHAAGITDTLCAALILLGLALQAGFTLATFKLFLIFAFLFFTSPTASHALANAALHSGLRALVNDPETKNTYMQAEEKAGD
jgi:multicomponent Na+:H+ antiporter subunit G